MALVEAFFLPHPPIIINEIGGQETRHVQQTIKSYQEVALKIKDLQVDTMIFLTPHNANYQDYFHVSPGPAAQGSFHAFGHPELSFIVEYDEELRENIIQEASKQSIPIGYLGEKDARLDHGVMVPLSFIKGKAKIVRISISGLTKEVHYNLGKAIQQVAHQSKKRIVFVASGDLSHALKKDGPYGYKKEGPIFDDYIKKALAKGDFTSILGVDTRLADLAKECGLRSLFVLAGVLDQQEISSNLLSYEGPFGVGYAVANFTVIKENENKQYLRAYQEQVASELKKRREQEDRYVRLARTSLEHYLKYHEYLPINKELEEQLINEKGAVFVTIKKDGKLRGCIGTLAPTKESIAEEIIHNAVSAGLRDPRFEKVQVEELGELSYSVDVLSTPEEIDNLDQLDPKQYGVIVFASGKSGLLLPNLEGIDTVEEQVKIVKQKANIQDGEPYHMKRFKVVRHL